MYYARRGFRNSPFAQGKDDLIRCEVCSLAAERKDLLGVLLHGELLPPRGIGSRVPSSRNGASI
jgi:hypothetical protein